MLCVSAFGFPQTRFVFLSDVCLVGSTEENQLQLLTLLQSCYLLTPVVQMWESGSKTHPMETLEDIQKKLSPAWQV